ncbi:hypothetical protein MK489_12550 [Myxococcota bacterium]|nr:hypothetical protein [Myxococcota bacterium]
MILRDVLLKAERFVAQHGDSLERARCQVLIREREHQRVIDLLGEPLAEGAPLDSKGLHAEMSRLWVLAESGQLGHPLAQAICEHLISLQHEAGCWGSPDESLDECVRTTGLVAGGLARTRWGGRAALHSAGDFLASHWSPERVKGDRLSDITSHALFFSNFAHEESDAVLQWCGREFERGFRTQVFAPLDAARVLVRCDAHALPGARVDAAELGACLLNEQAGDGGWVCADPDSPPPATTVQAVAVLRHFGVPSLTSLEAGRSNEGS